MKITFVLPFASLAGGIRVVAEYARILQKQGHDVWVISQPYQSHLRRRDKLMIRAGIRPAPQTPITSPLLAGLGDQHRVLTQPGPPLPTDIPDSDIIVATWWETAEWVAAMPASKGRKFYLLQGYETFDYMPVDRVIATYRQNLHMIAVSNFIKDQIETNHGVHGIDVVHNAVDVTHFHAPPRSKARQPTVGVLYSTTPCKNVDLAIDALTMAKRALPDLKAVSFGASPQHPDHKLPGWVDYHQNPPQDQIPQIYAACDAWLFTSTSEGFGLPILESMACRTPVLGTPAGAAPQLITAQNGILVDHTPAAFTAAIQQIASLDDTHWQAMSAAAYQTAQKHSWDQATQQLLAHFQAKT